jgi:glycosyltransferase involved in cell wall biosynthesis
MADMPLVSCIIPFLDQEKFLWEAIQSVLAQTYPHWELLLVDQGSVDGSPAIAKQWETKHPNKIRFLEHQKKQLLSKSSAFNLGVEWSQGQYLAFSEVQDVWLPSKLEQQLAILETNPEIAMLFGATYAWYGWTNQPDAIQQDRIVPLQVQGNTIIQPPHLLIQLIQDQSALPSLCDTLLRRESYDQVGEFEENDLGVDADLMFYTRLYYSAPVYVASKCWARHRQQDAGDSQSPNSSLALQQRGQFLQWVEQYLAKQTGEKTIEKILKQALWPYRHPVLFQLQQSPKLLQKLAKALEIALLPFSIRYGLGIRWHRRNLRPWLGWVRFGDFRQLRPISQLYGFERGQPVDRYYIEQFLERHSADIQGYVLEICDPFYTFKFGGDRVSQSDVLDADIDNPTATLIADLADAALILDNTYDCVILTQTLQFVYDTQAALRTIHRILKPGGVLLVTVPCISRLDHDNTSKWGEYWRFTTYSIRQLLAEGFPVEQVTVEAYGNVFTSMAFLYGLAVEELRQPELEFHDPTYELLVAARAVKSIL